MTSSSDLIAGIPSYMAEHLSLSILGRDSDAANLVNSLNDPSRIKRLYDSLTGDDKFLLRDIFLSGGEIDWVVFSRIYKDDINKARDILVRLGAMGLVFQGGLTGRDPIIMLPSLSARIQEDIEKVPDTQISWKEGPVPEIWKHILMVNALKTLGLKCRVGLEPFKKGWVQLEEKLDSIMDIRHVYWELSSLGCIKDANGEITVLNKPAVSLAIEGDPRYRLWRFINSCRPYNIDGEIFTAVRNRILRKDVLGRIITICLARITPPIEGISELSSKLLSEWLELGILQDDESGTYIRLPEEMFLALDGADISTAGFPYRDEVIIQPNMEIIVPKDFSLKDHLDIGELAELVKADVVSIYHITRQSVLRAVGMGWTSEKIGTFLDRISKHTMPENILKTISAWTSSISCARIITGTFLIASDKEKVPHGLEEVYPSVFRIPDNYEREIGTLLEKRGVLVEQEKEPDSNELSWGRLTPVKPARQTKSSFSRTGIYPFGMVTPLPYGGKGIEMLEGLMSKGMDIIIFYPKQGYGEISAHRINPVSIYIRSGAGFMEAINEDTGAVETFEVNKIRAILKEAVS